MSFFKEYNERLEILRKFTQSPEIFGIVGIKEYKRLEAMTNKLFIQIVDELDRPRVNEDAINENETLAVRQALKKVDYENTVNRIFKYYATQVIFKVQKEYYGYARNRAFGIINDLTASFVKPKGKISAGEIARLTKHIQGDSVIRMIKRLRTRTLDRLEDIILKSYKEVPKAKKIYREQYKKNLRGALNQMLRSMRGLQQGFLTETFTIMRSDFQLSLNAI